MRPNIRNFSRILESEPDSFCWIWKRNQDGGIRRIQSYPITIDNRNFKLCPHWPHSVSLWSPLSLSTMTLTPTPSPLPYRTQNSRLCLTSIAHLPRRRSKGLAYRRHPPSSSRQGLPSRLRCHQSLVADACLPCNSCVSCGCVKEEPGITASAHPVNIFL